MFKKGLLSCICAALIVLMASDANAFRGRRHRGNACGYGGHTYAVPTRSYYRSPMYGYGGLNYGRSSYYRPAISIGVGGSPYGYGYGTGFGGYGLGGYGYGGYPGYGYNRGGLSIGLGGFGGGW